SITATRNITFGNELGGWLSVTFTGSGARPQMFTVMTSGGTMLGQCLMNPDGYTADTSDMHNYVLRRSVAAEAKGSLGWEVVAQGLTLTPIMRSRGSSMLLSLSPAELADARGHMPAGGAREIGTSRLLRRVREFGNEETSLLDQLFMELFS